jgi:DNA repair exonuclease SbcCD ATPase subunit
MVYFKASDCANQFSEMMDLSEIDNIITNSNKSVKEHADDVEQLKAKKAEIDNELSRYEHLDEAIEAFNALNKLRKSIKEAETKLNTLKTLQKRHSDATYEFSKVTNPANAYVTVDGLETLAKAIDRNKAMYSKLEALCSKWHDAEYDVRRFGSVDSMVADFAKLYASYTDIVSKLSELDKLSNVQAERKRIKDDMAFTLQVYGALSDEFKREFPKVCPLCGKENCNEDSLSC